MDNSPPKDEYFDLYQEIARSAFADMLHDYERNRKYYEALKKAIDKMHERNLPAKVLDIGTGTGILSMMAVSCGADSVVAVEAFRPMADCAERIIENNGMADAIKIIKKRSTELKEEDLPQRANILVTEVFDTELIGEGAIETFNHAHKHLLDEDCIVVPDSATIYVQVVESPLAWNWNMPKLIADLDGEVLIRTPNEILECKGTCELHDIQLNQFPSTKFREIVEPTAVFQFDWSGKSVIDKNALKKLSVVAKETGTVQAFFMWWILKMDQAGEIRISCAPHWQHEDFDRLKDEKSSIEPVQNVIPWRDHWMQAVYYALKPIHVNSGDQLQLISVRDEFSLWFDLTQFEPDIDENKEYQLNRPLCTCGFHLAHARTRIGQLNNIPRLKQFLKVFDKTIDASSTVLFVSEGSLIGLVIAALKAVHVYYVDSNKYSRRAIAKYIEFNQLANITLLESIDDETIDYPNLTHVIGEPNFCTSILPWDQFYFGDIVEQIKSRCSENIQILPHSAKIKAVPVEFLDLHKIFAPFGVCESFDLGIFDRVIEESSEFADDIVEAQPLWEYPCKALGPAKTVFSVNFSNLDNIDAEKSSELTVESRNVSCNGIAFWTEYSFTDAPTGVVSTGPLKNIEENNFIEWDMYTRQGVHLFWKPIEVGDEPITVPCNCEKNNGAFSFNFA